MSAFAGVVSAAGVELTEVLHPLPKDRLDMRLECPVCFEEIVCDSDTWRILPCKHGVCSACLKNIVQAHVSLLPSSPLLPPLVPDPLHFPLTSVSSAHHFKFAGMMHPNVCTWLNRGRRREMRAELSRCLVSEQYQRNELACEVLFASGQETVKFWCIDSLLCN